ncbi:MAG: EamA family transporter, partial [Sporomusa sp.]
MRQKPAQADEQLLGVLSAIGAYLCWGSLPVYWKQLSQVPAYEILAHRIVWSFLFMVIVIVATGRVQAFINQLSEIRKNSKKLLGVVIASALVSANWLIYIWAVNANRVVETSLGY